MTRDIKGGANRKIDVYVKPTKNSIAYGEAFLKKDMPSQPFGDNFEIVSFWVEDKLMIYPLDMIEHVELYEVQE